MAARQFSADRDTMATPHEFGARKAPIRGVFLANFHTFPLAAIGHVQEFHVGRGLIKLEREMGHAARVDANGIVAGLSRASAANSLAELTGVSGLTTRMVVGRATNVIGAKSRSVS